MDAFYFTVCMFFVVLSSIYQATGLDGISSFDLKNTIIPDGTFLCLHSGQGCMKDSQICSDISRACENVFYKTEDTNLACCLSLLNNDITRKGLIEVCKYRLGSVAWPTFCEAKFPLMFQAGTTSTVAELKATTVAPSKPPQEQQTQNIEQQGESSCTIVNTVLAGISILFVLYILRKERPWLWKWCKRLRIPDRQPRLSESTTYITCPETTTPLGNPDNQHSYTTDNEQNDQHQKAVTNEPIKDTTLVNVDRDVDVKQQHNKAETFATDERSNDTFATDERSNDTLATDERSNNTLATDERSNNTLATDERSNNTLATDERSDETLATDERSDERDRFIIE